MNDDITKDKIFDDVVQTEDKMLEQLRLNILRIFSEKYGPLGESVVKKYYDLIDGNEDTENSELTEECDECKQRAKRMVDFLDFTQQIGTCFSTDYIYNEIESLSVNKKIIDKFNELKQLISESSNLKEAVFGTVIQLCRKQNDHTT